MPEGDQGALVQLLVCDLGDAAQDGLAQRLGLLRFARLLATHGAAQYFDVYSHHPYTPGGSRYAAPNKPPNDPSTTVTVYNLPSLLRLIPTKPFYLTEYGYTTADTYDFGGFKVSQIDQARYLREAYSYVKRWNQVKVLFWLLDRDVAFASGSPLAAIYSGLRTADGRPKLAWYAYAGGNLVGIAAPSSFRRGTYIRITGTVSNKSAGVVAGRTVVLQSRRYNTHAWTTVGSRTTSSTGGYVFTPRPGGSRAYRVVWRGVATSAIKLVPMR